VTVSGTFSSFSNALSALRYNQVAMDVASGNVANAGTTGYARRQVIGQATGAPSTPAVWSRWEGAGDGVEAGGVRRMTDALLDRRARTEHATQSYLDARAASLVRFETTLAEPGDNGIAAALSAFKAGWQDVANNPADGAARSQLLARAQTLATAVNDQAASVSTEWDYQRTTLDTLAEEVNKTASDLFELNESLRAASLSGTDAGTLLDQRDQLALRLAELTGATTTVNGDTTVTVRIGDAVLVQAPEEGPPKVAPFVQTLTLGGGTKVGDVTATSPNPVSISVGGVEVAPTGEMGGSQSLLNQDLPTYLKDLDAFATTMADAVNTQHAKGFDLNGTAGGPVFRYDATDPAGSLTVAITNPDEIAAAAGPVDPVTGAGQYDGSNAGALGTADLGDETYRELITSFGVSVASTNRLAENQRVLAGQVDASREALSGINIDEEMVHLLTAQRAYEGASRVLTTIDSVLDTLINRTGITR
jgi:flagellar hook-associated protein 1 FlgK